MIAVDTGAVFSELAPLWSTRDRAHAEATEAVARRVVSSLRSGGSVLDVGSGTGALLGRVRAEARRTGRTIGRTVGVDLAPDMAELTDTRRGVRGVTGDGTRLPFRDQIFDVVVSRHVLHFVADPIRAAREMVRVTLPGGTIVAEVQMPGTDGPARRLAEDLPQRSLLRRYLELPRSYQAGTLRRALEDLHCDVRVTRAPGGLDDHTSLLTGIARASGSRRDLAVAAALRDLPDPPRPHALLLVARLPGPRTGSMPITVNGLPGWTPDRVRRLIADLPQARGYRLEVKPLRWRSRPHVQAFCEFYRQQITVQVPMPFLPFHEDVPFRAQRVGAGGFRFRWYRRRLRFERPHELIRYLYLHEYYHWYMREVLGKRSAAAETACDRFALQRL